MCDQDLREKRQRRGMSAQVISFGYQLVGIGTRHVGATTPSHLLAVIVKPTLFLRGWFWFGHWCCSPKILTAMQITCLV